MTISPVRRPRYVEHGGEIVPRPPTLVNDARMYSFVVEADRDLLDGFCERCFTRPSEGSQHWRAAGRYVLLNFVDILSMRSADPLDRWLGTAPEQETSVWLPVLDVRRRRLAWAVAYMFVDSGLTLADGRETYGYPKQLGTMHIPRTDSAPDALWLDALTITTFHPESIATMTRVLEANRTGQDTTPLRSVWEDPAGVARDLAAQVGRSAVSPEAALVGASTALLFGRQILARSVPLVLLKQFRDVAEPGSACYQAIVEVAHRVTRFRRGGFLPDDYAIQFADLDAQPVRRELGIAGGTVHPRLAFWVECDFAVDLGNVLWEAGSGRA